jgi:hypothetical protein
MKNKEYDFDWSLPKEYFEQFKGYEISHWVKGDVVIPDYVYRFVCAGYTPESNEQWIVTDKGATRLDGKYKDETLTGVYHKIYHSL